MNYNSTSLKTGIKSILISVFSLFCFFSFSNSAEAQMKYILFDNFDPDFIDSAYYLPFKNYDGLIPYDQYLVKAPFSAATFSQYKITDFDLAIFPMGDNKLGYSTSGITVISKIKEMIAAGKNVMVTGRDMVNKALGSGSDNNADVKDFLSNTMGINFIKKKLVSSYDGTTLSWWSFYVRGHDPDPVGISAIKACNMGFNGGWPLANYLALDVFKSKDVTKNFEVEHFIYGQNDLRNDTIVATRTEIGTSRILLYSMGIEAFAGEIPRSALLHRAVVWCLGNIKPDGAEIQFDPPNLDFGRLPIDSSRSLSFTLTSVGKEDLVITETSFWENPDDAYKITAGEIKSGKNKTLKSGQTHTITISFTPKAKKEYPAQLSIYTNSISGNIKDINLDGFGGNDNSGAKISTNFGKSIDFGKVQKTKSKIIDLVIYNTGDKELTIQKFRMDTTQPDQDRFIINQTLPNPLFVKPQDSLTIKIKFAATVDEERIYRGKIIVECDALNDPQFTIDLMGEIMPFMGVDDQADINNHTLIMSVSPNPSADKALVKCNLTLPSAYVNLCLTDISGNRIMQIANTTLYKGESSFDLDLKKLSSGKYFVIAEINGKSIIANIIVNK